MTDGRQTYVWATQPSVEFFSGPQQPTLSLPAAPVGLPATCEEAAHCVSTRRWMTRITPVDAPMGGLRPGGSTLPAHEKEKSMSHLQWKLLVKKRGSSTQGVPPGKEHLAWVANTVTLVSGERDAVLVDTFLSDAHSRELAQWVADSGKNLTTIYVTHAHGDHFLGLGILLERFPHARAVAAPSVVEGIRSQIRPDFIKSFWEPRFPGQLPSRLVAPEPLEGDGFLLEGERMVAVPLGHTDTVDTTALHVPSLDLLIAGDSVYNDTHLYLAECDAEDREEWLRALDVVEALHPKSVVAGHGVLDPDSSPRHIEETRRYIKDFNNALRTTGTHLELYEKMLALYPDRVNPGSLWGAAKAAKP